MPDSPLSRIKAFFEPRSIAAIGSLREVLGTAYWLIRNMRQFGYEGPIYPVNPNSSSYEEIMGTPAYPDITTVPGPVDLAVLLTPPAVTPQTIEECATSGVRAAIILSEGFAESGRDGGLLQRQLTDIAHRTGIRIMGPNTFGVLNTANHLATIAPYLDQDKLEAGGIAFCGQTGSMGPHQMPIGDWACPVSKMCDIGNKCDVNESDILEYLAEDEQTSVIAMHLEDIKDGARFMKAINRTMPHKPVLILKTGRTEAGSRASASHTGSIMGSDDICDAALRQAGALRVETWQELWEIPRTLVCQPLPGGDRFAFITFTGGQGVIAADAASRAGLHLAEFTPTTFQRLTSISERLGRNPVDVGPAMSDSRTMSSSNPFHALEQSINATLDDPGVDCVTITFSTGRQLVPIYPQIVDMLTEVTRDCPKTINVWIYGTSLEAISELVRQLQQRGLPSYTDLDMAVRAHAFARRYALIRQSGSS